MSQGQNVTVDVLIGSKCHCDHSELGRFVQASSVRPLLTAYFNVIMYTLCVILELYMLHILQYKKCKVPEKYAIFQIHGNT
jgi:hypothetical protein